ncbi:pilus assembly protein PilX [Lachnospiraceae bacterium oral taxon 500]|nr:pilus assembly protein PilX [Lachnospiraceae bacterium oral taxon 500]
MRKWNAVLTLLIFILFLLHAVFGSLQMLGVGNTALKGLSWAAVGLITVHTLIGLKLTLETLKVQRQTGVFYWRENKLFWARRISGLAVMLLLFCHLTAFSYTRDGAYRLHWFTAGRLTVQLFLLAAVGVHIITNVKPLLIAFGVKGLRSWLIDMLVILSVLLLFMAAAFVVYYLRWNVF